MTGDDQAPAGPEVVWSRNRDEPEDGGVLESVVLSPSLVIRKSTGPAPG